MRRRETGSVCDEERESVSVRGGEREGVCAMRRERGCLCDEERERVSV